MDLEGARLAAGRYSRSPGERMWAEPGQKWHEGRWTGSQTSLGDETPGLGQFLLDMTM